MTTKVQAAKNLAKQIALALGQHGQELPHSVLLEVVAKAQGARNWHAFQVEPEVAVAPAPVVTGRQWSPAQGWMADSDYLQFRGVRCAVCGNKHFLEAEDVEADGDTASCKVECSNCSSTWTDVYTLCGFEDLEHGFYAEENKLVYALELWLTEDKATVSDDRQEALDELVHENVQAYGSQHVARHVNDAVDRQEQEEIIEDGEAFASKINNHGIQAQLRFLQKVYSSEDDFINELARVCEISRDNLKL
jgi:hypothetical protein